jgi:tetratricopeptide (TPR) repeat protein
MGHDSKQFLMNGRFIFHLATIGILFLATVLAEDASDVFMSAYQEFQAGELSERNGNLRDALNRYANAANALENLQKNNPGWQKIAVNYRLRKSRESLERLRETIQNAPPLESVVEDPLPTRGFEIDIPAPQVTTRPLESRSSQPNASQSAPKPSPPVRAPQPSGSRNESEATRLRISKLEEELESTKGLLSSARMEVEKTKTELVDTKSRLAQSEQALDNAVKERESLRSRVAIPPDKLALRLSSRIAELEAEIEVLADENTRLTGKLGKAANYIQESAAVLAQTDKDRRAVAKQRDQALARIKRLKDNDAELAQLKSEREKLVKEFASEKNKLERQIAEQSPKIDLLEKLQDQNKELAARLLVAEKSLAGAIAGKAGQPSVEDLQKEIALLQDRLAASREELRARDDNMKALMAQLDELTGEAARLRLYPKPTQDQKRLSEENELLKSIVVRQLKEQNERAQAVGLLQQELDKLYVKSDSLSGQMAVLTRPMPRLSDDELLLFNNPTMMLSDPSDDRLSISMAIVKKPDGSLPDNRKQNGVPGSQDLSPESQDLLRKAMEHVQNRRFSDAEKLYHQVLDSSPDNYFVLSNLAVTQIQANKLPAALLALQKALEIVPGDIYASINLANVYCRQGRLDESIDMLKEVLKVDPQNAVANNYMAVALGRKGDMKAAEEYFRRSITVDDKYPNAHFNLAVMYVNSDPPSYALAKKHYEIAKSLGAEPDTVMERRLEQIPSAGN